eukprot:CAMPEP_0184500582 /NCGR_PEP_ID=MMETSP0113_2-20130426/45246_1 /TAXON_ID=91329 /ORGANISM="Norrisiella sphaerica, Strain BC52" /LENGTH=553 /DNA_ID=CAMNT_0026889003 /DNA_START=222 /DNA_END=1883 /DNA_ORIENTATION=-
MALSIEDKVTHAAEWAMKIRRRREKTATDASPSTSITQPATNTEGAAQTGENTNAVLEIGPFPSVVSGYELLYSWNNGEIMEKMMDKLKPRCRWEDAVEGVLLGCVSGDQCQEYGLLESAKETCQQAGSKCGGVIKRSDGKYEIRSGKIIRNSPSNEISYLRVCEFHTPLPPPEYQVIPGTDIDSIGTVVDGLPTIFVSVASFRDHRCTGTLLSLFERAKFPRRIFVGVVQQNSALSDYDKHCVRTERKCTESPGQTLCKYARQIRVHMVQAEESLGPTFGRHRADRLYRGETYALQIDAHSTMLKDWDVHAIEQHKRTGNEYAVMTNYPSDVSAIDANGHAKMGTTPMMCKSHFEREMLRFDSNPEIQVPARLHGSPVLQPFWGAGASFSKGHRIVRVPYDCCLSMMFTGEEISMATRMWTNGYDLYTFHHSVIYHQYLNSPGDKRPPMFWDNQSSHQNDAQKSINRVKMLLGISQPPGTYWDQDIEKYGLGDKRPVSKYFRLFGIDFARRIVKDNCPIVTSFQLHDKMIRHLRPDGKGIDYSNVPDDLFHP